LHIVFRVFGAEAGHSNAGMGTFLLKKMCFFIFLD